MTPARRAEQVAANLIEILGIEAGDAMPILTRALTAHRQAVEAKVWEEAAQELQQFIGMPVSMVEPAMKQLQREFRRRSLPPEGK